MKDKKNKRKQGRIFDAIILLSIFAVFILGLNGYRVFAALAFASIIGIVLIPMGLAEIFKDFE